MTTTSGSTGAPGSVTAASATGSTEDEPFGHEPAHAAPGAIEATGIGLGADRGRERRTILDGVDLTVERGELVAVMGPSGSGKTTLLEVCVGLLVPDRGVVRIAGLSCPPPGSARLAALWRDTLGYVEQRQNLIGVLTTAENVALPLRFGRRPDDEVRAATAAVLDEVGLTDVADVAAADLSGGEQQRAAIARALIGTRLVVVADEPTAALDTATGETIVRLLRRRCDDRGAAVLMATHDARHAAWADRVVNLRDGRVASIST